MKNFDIKIKKTQSFSPAVTGCVLTARKDLCFLLFIYFNSTLATYKFLLKFYAAPASAPSRLRPKN